MSKDDSYVKVMGLYVKYWESVLKLLSKPIPQHSYVLLEFFYLLVIGKLIMNVHPFILLLMLTLKILSSLHTMGLEACTFL
jgi:hypothetical protein